jgi:hypothetical protein
MSDRRRAGQRDRRLLARAEYRQTAPALLELEGCRCAVRDLGLGGLRVEPAPAGRVWQEGEQVSGTLHLRAGERVSLCAWIGRVDHGGLALIRDGDLWPTAEEIDAERMTLVQRQRERRSAARLAISAPAAGGGPRTPLRDVSATGLRYVLTPMESAPAIGSRIEGALRLDADTVIDVRGRVVRHMAREIAVAFDPPGLDPAVLALLQRRFVRPAATG